MADEVNLPSQEFDFTNLWAPNVVCRYAPSNGDVNNYPDQYTAEGVMTGDPWDEATHINVITQPGYCDAFPGQWLAEVPEGEFRSVRLGNYYPMCGVEDVEYSIRVDTTRNPILVFRFMPILMESHEAGAGAAFSILDANGNVIDNQCMNFKFSLEGDEIQGDIPGDPVWHRFESTWEDLNPLHPTVHFQYLDWTSIGIDLTPYHNQKLTIRIQTFDCQQQQHFGLCYFTLKTQPKRIRVNACEDGKLIYEAPDGFYYRWYKSSDLARVLSTAQRYEAQPPYDKEYICELSVNKEFTCSTQVRVAGVPPLPVAQFDYEVHHGICADTVYFTNKSYASPDGVNEFAAHADCDSALWDFGEGIYLHNGLNTASDYKLFSPVIFTQSGSYKIKLKACLYRWDCKTNEVVKTIHINREAPAVLYDTVCSNSPLYVGEKIVFTQPGDTTFYYDVTDHECEMSLPYVLHVHTEPAYLMHEYLSYCKESSVIWHGKTIKHSGLYTDTLTSLLGCDSVIMLHAEFIQPEWVREQASLCSEEDAYSWRGKTYTIPGIYRDTVADEGTCSRIYELNLRQGGTTTSTQTYSLAAGEVIHIGDKAYSSTGIFLDTLINALGCDSVITINITPKTDPDDPWGRPNNPGFYCAPTSSKLDTTIAYDTLQLKPLVWFGKTYTAPGLYRDTLINGNHQLCDSIGKLLLRVTYNADTTINDTSKAIFHTPWGDYEQLSDCDCWSGCLLQTEDEECVVLASLCATIVHCEPTDSTTTATICEGETFNWYGQIYKESKTTTMTLTNAAGCDSICRLKLTVLPVTRQRFGRSICEGTTTTWRGRVLDKAGTYDTILYYVNGCDSIRDTLDLTIDEMYRDSVAYKICQGEHITWRGNTYTQTGDYSVHAIGKNGDCDSILKLHIDVALPTRLDTALYRCYSDPFPFNWEGHSIKRVGDTVLHTTNKAGCDSTIRVTVYQSPEPYTIEEDSSFCDGSYIEDWHGKQIWNGGTYYATEKCKNPHFATCDSINYVLHVTKKYPTHGDTTVYVCACEMPITWDFQGQKRTLADPGTYNIRTLTNVVGCDSTLTITIVVSDEVKTDIIDTTLCEGSSIQWQGRTIDQEGHYYDTTKCKDIHFLRCDSIYHELHVTIAHHTDSVTYATICRGETFEWHGETYTETTHRTITIDNAAGCDSVCTLHLTVNEPSSSLTTASICMGQTYQWNGYSFTNSVDTTIQLLNSVGCDSLCRLVLTAAVCCPDTQMRRTVIPSMCDTLLPYQWQTWRTQPILINNPGSYADTLRNKWGCDSIIYTLDIDFHHCCRDLKGEMNVGDVCADDDYLSLSLDLHSGMMNEYRLHFTNPTLNKMPIRDTVVHLSEEDWATGTIHIDIPIPHDPEDSTRYPRPDNYFVDVLVSDSCGNTLRWEQVPFTIFYPSWLILQRWNDVLALYNEKYNGGYTFSQIRWFHEDTLLTARGEHDGYIYVRPTLEYGTPYYAELTRTDDGKTFPTCAYFPRPQRDTIIFKEEVEISHNLIGPGANRIGVKTNTNGTYDIYDIGGHCVQHGYFGAEHDALYIDFNTRLPEGVYILLFRGKELLQPEKLIHDKE